MARSFLDVRREGPVCVLTLRREEKLNALSTAFEEELAAAIAGDEVGSSACVVVTGGDRVFSAGADVTEFNDVADTASILAYYRRAVEVYERFASLPQPTFSAIAGYCLGGGFELALATDFRIADETAIFGLPEVSIGIVPTGGMHRLVRIAGTARAKELVLLRRRVPAREALSLGVVTEVVEAGLALPRALELAAGVAALPRLAVTTAKQVIDRLPEASRDAGVFTEWLAYAALAQTHDAREAADAFVEKRPPRFESR